MTFHLLFNKKLPFSKLFLRDSNELWKGNLACLPLCYTAVPSGLNFKLKKLKLMFWHFLFCRKFTARSQTTLTRFIIILITYPHL